MPSTTPWRRSLPAGGAVILDEQRREMLRNILLIDGHLNTDIVGRPAWKIAALAGFEVPETAKVLIGEAEVIGREEPLSFEKLSPVLGMYRAKDFDDAVEKAAANHEVIVMAQGSMARLLPRLPLRTPPSRKTAPRS